MPKLWREYLSRCTHFSSVLHFIQKPVIEQNKRLVSIWNATLGWNGLSCYIRIGRLSDQIPPGTWSGLVTQHRYEAPVDHWVEHRIQTQWLTWIYWGCSLSVGPKLVVAYVIAAKIIYKKLDVTTSDDEIQ